MRKRSLQFVVLIMSYHNSFANEQSALNLNEERYYPQDRCSYFMWANGNWSWKITVGSDTDSGLKFKILAVLANENANKEIIDYLNNYGKSYPGMERLPDGATIYDSISVTRK